MIALGADGVDQEFSALEGGKRVALYFVRSFLSGDGRRDGAVRNISVSPADLEFVWYLDHQCYPGAGFGVDTTRNISPRSGVVDVAGLLARYASPALLSSLSGIFCFSGTH